MTSCHKFVKKKDPKRGLRKGGTSMYPEIKLFIDSPTTSTNGQWVMLPVGENLLMKTIKKITNGRDYIIADYETNYDLSIKEYSNVYDLNEQFEILTNIYYQNNKNTDQIETVISATDSLEEAIQTLINENFYYFENINDIWDLGLATVNNETWSIPKHLEDYIDYEKIGQEYIDNGALINKNLKTAIYIY